VSPRPSGLLIGACVMLAAAAVASGLSSIDGSGGYAGLSPRFLPGVVATGLGVCGLLLFLGRLRRQPRHHDAAVAPGSELPGLPFAGRGAAVWLIGGLIAHLVLIAWIGFVAASVLLMTCAARGHGSRRPVRDAIVAFALALPVWWLFSHGLGLGLPLFPLLRS
jgi:putative tricarboxylic transport membrane protein